MLRKRHFYVIANSLDLTEFEASKAKLRQIEAAEREAEEQVRQSGAVGHGPKRGNREAARRTGISEQEVRRTKGHVAAAEEHPVFQGPQWKRSQVLAATEALETLPKRDRAAVVVKSQAEAIRVYTMQKNLGKDAEPESATSMPPSALPLPTPALDAARPGEYRLTSTSKSTRSVQRCAS